MTRGGDLEFQAVAYRNNDDDGAINLYKKWEKSTFEYISFKPVIILTETITLDPNTKNHFKIGYQANKDNFKIGSGISVDGGTTYSSDNQIKGETTYPISDVSQTVPVKYRYKLNDIFQQYCEVEVEQIQLKPFRQPINGRISQLKNANLKIMWDVDFGSSDPDISQEPFQIQRAYEPSFSDAQLIATIAYNDHSDRKSVV